MRVEPWLRERVGVEQPLAGDVRAVGRLGPERVEHHVVGVQREQQIGKDRVEVDPVAVLRGQVPHRRPTRPPGERQAPAGGGDHHVPAQIGPLEQIVFAARVGRELREPGMDHRAMEAFGIILEHELPVGADSVVDAGAGAESLDVESAEAALDRGERARERLGVARQIDEQESLPRRERDGVQRIVPLVEARHLAHVRRADQRAVERVRPGVVGTLDRFGQAAARAVAQPGAAVTAHIVEGAHRAVLPAHQDDALPRDRADHVLPGRAQLGGAPDAHPPPREDPLLLLGVDPGVHVVAARQRALSLLVGLGGLDEGGHDA